MFLIFIGGCAFFQAGASQKDFEQAPYKRIYAEKLKSELMGVGDQELRMQKISQNEDGLTFQIQSQDMCIKRDTYNELHYSQSLGTPMVGPTWELGQLLGWGADVSVLGLSYAALGAFREEKEDIKPELIVGAVGLTLIGVNAYALSQSSESRYKNQLAEKETLVPCGNWRTATDIKLEVRNEGTAIPVKDQRISMTDIANSWLESPNDTLQIQWNVHSTVYQGTKQGSHTLSPKEEWLCSGLESKHLTSYLNSKSPAEAFAITKNVSCPKALTQKICQAYSSLVQNSTYSIGNQSFSSGEQPLSMQHIHQYKEYCDVLSTWTQTFIAESNKLIDKRIGLFEISELIEQHDGLISIYFPCSSNRFVCRQKAVRKRSCKQNANRRQHGNGFLVLNSRK